MKIKLLALGKMKNRAFAEVARDYIQRIQRLHPFEVVEIPDEPRRGKTPLQKILNKEGEKIKKQIKTKAFLIALDEKGREWSSQDLAGQLKGLFEGAHSEIVFLIGGAQGLSPLIKDSAPVVLSLSKLTLPHQLARVLTLEQIYRALTILKHMPYHNE